MTATVPTASMIAKAAILVSEQAAWQRGRSKQTGESFWLIPASTGASAHYATSNGCTCRSFQHRGVCSHVVAVRQFEESRPAPASRTAEQTADHLARLERELAARAKTLRLIGYQRDELHEDPKYSRLAEQISKVAATLAIAA